MDSDLPVLVGFAFFPFASIQENTAPAEPAF